ncbi:MAG: bifunctional D-glycero-beta-D-manno-heptose-7-phosphate kinase/D-glycero-beta-D-manno-heptose 1-phosphate adenylyltransferase HldE [Porticoccaceae bacterium]|jgi:D-beta-D-heptose 7-phosphate kinase/D-beta-D-heptose 1-phosphate adenosyltransferase|nr:bifunctional D-glycero-beta-D-manno-heptose-7-phosphate kinase/D-glycero-beta-D-manno-heptose 1-phosphate adenylyltransferase HldE [Porticoccaceae bacterium]HLS97090.1 bifunctional D-glycero-beta-D-manno-heptose-7-phosphate kinase/D-glycero-beta-D-manno-heptose 1-phosphate adenylyltransferase HldE [Porticoccaceae bacterium]
MKLEFPRFDSAQVLVVGDLMLDRYWYGSTSRISPEAPVPVVKVGHTEDRIGGAGNVALNIASLGAGASLVAVVGRDEAAEALRSRLDSAGIFCDFQVSDSHPTITKLRVVSRSQQLLRMDFEEAFEREDASQLVAKTASRLEGIKAMVLSDYGKGALLDPQALIAAAGNRGIPVLVDPKGTDFDRYWGATLLTPNLHEFEAVVGPCASEHELAEKGLALVARLALEALLVTRGEQGMTLIRPGQPALHLPARAREVFDVTGAGDTVISVLAAALAAGEELPEAVALANIAAGIVVGKLGTATVSGPELRRAMQQEQGSERGVVNEEQLAIDLEVARAHGERIVFTNGCFDILHAGHVGYLEQARKLGDRLVVAVNGDESVKRLKGEGRPINPVERRMAVLAGLEAVDWVVPFEDDTPERLLALLRPDILVKGGDYSKESVVGWEIVESYGGEVRALDFLDNCSTTAIVEKVRGGK